jgi:6-carboxyhexanoate--CoA ligase
VYSVRMRAAQGGRHEEGGRHISGAERVVPYERIEATAAGMLQRAFSHTRGSADFISITVEKVERCTLQRVPLLSISAAEALTVEEGHAAAIQALVAAGVTIAGATRGISTLLSLTDSMRGAILLCAVTGERLDAASMRGIRVSRMDIEDEEGFIKQLIAQKIHNTHVREALVLASKVAAGPGMAAELCWSDDPEYTTGYVASQQGYVRIPHCKPLGNSVGGRVFFIKPRADISLLENYLQHQPVLVTI